MTGRYEHVLSFALDHPWALTPPMLQVVAAILARRIAGEEIAPAELEAALVKRKNLPQPRAGSIAIIPVYGVIAPRMNLMSELSGGTTFERLSGQLAEATGDKTVKNIVLDIDSPGGNVAGATEFAHEVMRARTKKPIIAQIQYTGASAAYWMAAAATEIVAAPSAKVGSIGVYAIHDDLSDAFAKLGIKRRYLAAGEGKVDGNETGPLTDEAEARLMKALREAEGMFVGDVVKGRGAGMTADRVRQEWKAHVYGAAEAKTLGMIDSIGTLNDTVTRVLSASPDAEDQRAASQLASPVDTAQEPLPASAQDRTGDLVLERQLFELQLSRMGRSQ
jgi:signal peptide peptidase SppA